MEDNVYDLDSKLGIYRTIHKEAAQINHGIEIKNVKTHEYEWVDYTPTRFIYSFFTFNTLYNIDWHNSLRSGNIHFFRREDDFTEEEKQDAYLSFVFKDEEFVSIFKDAFINYITRDITANDIIVELREIQPDRDNNGSVRSPQYIKTFQDSMKSLLLDKTFNKKTVSTILDFIYSIRCNIFHGVKTMKQMLQSSQIERLDIYTSVIIAINQMCFSYIEYLIDGGDYVEKNIENVFSRLRILSR